MSGLKSAVPAHLKSALGGGNNNDATKDFAKKHHGKTQSHMVSCVYFL
jgi:UTP--glucose-1-phosphate uridylyltransferase